MNLNDLATYRIRPELRYGFDLPDEYPMFQLVHSICNKVVSDHRVSVSLVEIAQKALNHTKECRS